MPVSVYPPAGPDSPIGFEAQGVGGKWTGVLMPVRVVGPGEGLDEGESDAVTEAVERMVDVLTENGATIEIDGQVSVFDPKKRKRGKPEATA